MKIGAVLPLCISGSYGGDDLKRTDILFRSLKQFLRTDFIESFWVVTPDDEVETVKNYLDKWCFINIQVIGETTLVPQLKKHEHLRGWRKQQVIKLAAANLMKSEFYLTFDADVICLKPLGYSNLIIDDRALIQYEPRSFHPKWWKASARILNITPQLGDPTRGMHVTPAILSVELAHLLLKELGQFDKFHWVDNLCGLHDPSRIRNWRLSRYLKLKWTEYSLYYLCALKHNLLDKYHVEAGTEDNPQLLLVHDSHPFQHWQPEYNFSHQCRGLFCVVGSKTRLDPDVVWEKVSPFFDEQPVALT